MRMTKLCRVASLVVFALTYVFHAGLGGRGCAQDKPESKVTKANADKIKAGMTLKEVEEILGPGKEAQASDFPPARTRIQQRIAQQRQQILDRGGKALKWEDGKKVIILVFANGKVAITSTRNLGADPPEAAKPPAGPEKK
jgi:hypothetical protein